MSTHTKNTKPIAYAASLVAMRVLSRFDGRLLTLLGATTAAITAVGLNG